MLSLRGDNNPNSDKNTLTSFRISPVQFKPNQAKYWKLIYDIDTAGEFQPNVAQSMKWKFIFVQTKSIFFYKKKGYDFVLV